MRFFFISTILLYTALLPLSAQSNLRAEIEKIIKFDTEIDFKNTPGFMVAILDDTTEHYFAFGHKVKNTQTYLSETDVFELGSVTKPYMTYIARALENDKFLSLDDPVNRWVDSSFVNPRLSNLTIRQLIEHSSGLPKRPTWFGKKEKNAHDPYAHYTERDLMKYYRDYIPDKKPKAFQYSHLNYALLEHIIVEAGQMSLQDLLQKYICQPLEMQSTFFDGGENKSSFVTQGYTRSGKTVAPWSYASFKGSEGLKSTPADALSFASESMSHIRRYSNEQSQGLSSSIFSSHGWQCITAQRTIIYTHSGQTSGHNVFYSMVPATNTAVVIMANSSIGTEDLAISILRMINYNWKRKHINQ